MNQHQSKGNPKANEVESLLEKIVTEKSPVCELLTQSTSSIQRAVLQKLIDVGEKYLPVREALARDLTFRKFTELSGSSELAFQWLLLEPDEGIKYFLFVRLIYNVQHNDAPGSTHLTTLLKTDVFVIAQVLHWLSRYPRDRALAEKMYRAIAAEWGLLNDKDTVLLSTVEKIMALSPEQYDAERVERFLDEWHNKIDMGFI